MLSDMCMASSQTEMIGPLIEFLCQSTGDTFSCAVNWLLAQMYSLFVSGS